MLYQALLALLPRNRLGDRAVAFINFVVRHKRLPSKRPLFNDALYRIKVSDEILDPLRVFVSDKEFVKLYVRAVVGEDYNVPTIALLLSPDEAEAYDYPHQCCIKPTHASGQTIFRTAGEPVDRERIRSWFGVNHYDKAREANYRKLKPKVIVEPLLFQSGETLDYRFFCVNGKVKFITVDVDWTTPQRSRQLFDAAWNRQAYSLGYLPGDAVQERPGNFAEMTAVAEKLAAGFDFIRIDLYSDGDTCLVGEITNCHASANGRFVPPSAEITASRLLFG